MFVVLVARTGKSRLNQPAAPAAFNHAAAAQALRPPQMSPALTRPALPCPERSDAFPGQEGKEENGE